MDLAIEFTMKEITGIFQQSLQKGMLQFTLQKAASNDNKNNNVKQ